MVKRAAVAAVLYLVLGSAVGAQAQTVVNVTANVGQACIAITDGSFYFAITDPAAVTPATSVVLPTVQCTNGAVATITFESGNAPGPALSCAIGSGNGGYLQETAGSTQFYYTFTCGDGTVTGIGVEPVNRAYDVSIPIDGSVAANETASAPPGAYADTITLTYSF